MRCAAAPRPRLQRRIDCVRFFLLCRFEDARGGADSEGAAVVKRQRPRKCPERNYDSYGTRAHDAACERVVREATRLTELENARPAPPQEKKPRKPYKKNRKGTGEPRVFKNRAAASA